MNVSKFVFAVLLMVSLGLNAFLIYGGLDQAVTIDHGQTQLKRYKEEQVILARMSKMFLAQTSEADFRAWASNNTRDLDVFDKENQLIINGVGVRFESGQPHLELPQEAENTP